jgi:hypothetical protein
VEKCKSVEKAEEPDVGSKDGIDTSKERLVGHRLGTVTLKVSGREQSPSVPNMGAEKVGWLDERRKRIEDDCASTLLL